MTLVDSCPVGGVISTLRINDPPSPAELERRLAAGCLPYPSQMSSHIVLVQTGLSPTDEATTAQFHQNDKKNGRRVQSIRLTSERDCRRQARYGELLRSHYVPLAPFTTVLTQREGAGTVPTLEDFSKMVGQMRQVKCDKDYVMCAGFYPHPKLYNHQGGHGVLVMPQPVVQLDRMYLRDVAPPPPRRPLPPTTRSILGPI